MSKNSHRLIRTLMAGAFFVGLGVFAMLTLDGNPTPYSRTPSRNPATKTCSECGDLSRLKADLLALPATPKTRAKRAAIELREGKMLILATDRVVDLLRKREPTGEELQAVTQFLVETADRDGSGIVLDGMSEALSETQMDRALVAIEAQIAELVSENVFTANQAEAYRARLSAFRSQGDT